ncbi:prospero homeobox protein 1-like [Mercenaria mercenaria]|uniref:prospero homeobox protein 1-like n=1 Tax=Mercenaria mercenaria TaxID=6596 RepID=UPI00234EB4BA|nr:prospero homeobox protein 1-like [Mercenaria mercenaria]
MVNIDQPVVSESQIILREILQNRESVPSETNIDKSVKMHDTQSTQLKPDHENIVPGCELNGEHFSRSDRGSETGSDEESSYLDQSRVDETDGDDQKSDADETGSIDVHSNEESKEAKRARVENILTSMQHPQFVDMEAMYGMNEVRRQKRKQTLPQQHEQTAKIRKFEGPPYEEDLWNLRHQINAVQSYFRQYDDSLPKHMNGYGAMDNIHRLHQAYFANLSARHAEELQKEQQQQLQNRAAVLGAFEKKVSSANEHFNIAEHVRETMNANKGLSQGVAELNDKELNELIANLKSKIEEAVSVTVDKELSKFFQKRNNHKDTSHENRERHSKSETNQNDEKQAKEPEKKHTTDHSLNHILQMPDRSTNNNAFRVPERHSAFELPKLSGGLQEIPRAPFPHHPPLGYPPLSFYLPTTLHPQSMYSCPVIPPEQTEALSLVVNTPKKKRTKVTDTRLSPRAARALLHENGSLGSMFEHERALSSSFGQMNPPCLPTSVAIPNPSLQHSDILNYYKESMCNSPSENDRTTPCSSTSPSEGGFGYMKSDFFNDGETYDSHGKQITDTLTPMHLRKAKLMFFYVRYPSSAILKVYFPDVQFNKNNTAQLVKWFSNFREFYYIQMEKYARQAIAEGCKHSDELTVTTESELYRVLNLHYNRNNQIEVPENFRLTVQATLREFFIAVAANKDTEPSWKKPIYKVIARMDDSLPEYFKSPNWMDQLGDA